MGVGLVHGQMKAVLSRYGLKPIDAVGKKFDPRVMEAMMQEISDAGHDVAEDPDALLDQFLAYRPPAVERWVDRESS